MTMQVIDDDLERGLLSKLAQQLGELLRGKVMSEQAAM